MFYIKNVDFPGYNATREQKNAYDSFEKARRVVEIINSYSQDLDYYTIYGTFDLERLEDLEIQSILQNLELNITFKNYMLEVMNKANGASWFWTLPFAVLGYYSQKRFIAKFKIGKEEYLI